MRVLTIAAGDTCAEECEKRQTETTIHSCISAAEKTKPTSKTSARRAFGKSAGSRFSRLFQARVNAPFKIAASIG